MSNQKCGQRVGKEGEEKQQDNKNVIKHKNKAKYNSDPVM